MYEVWRKQSNTARLANKNHSSWQHGWMNHSFSLGSFHRPNMLAWATNYSFQTEETEPEGTVQCISHDLYWPSSFFISGFVDISLFTLLQVKLVYVWSFAKSLASVSAQTDRQPNTKQLQNKQVLFCKCYAQDSKSGWEERKNPGSVPGCVYFLVGPSRRCVYVSSLFSVRAAAAVWESWALPTALVTATLEESKKKKERKPSSICWEK